MMSHFGAMQAAAQRTPGRDHDRSNRSILAQAVLCIDLCTHHFVLESVYPHRIPIKVGYRRLRDGGGGEVWALCGEPDVGGSTSMKHDAWVKNAFLGHWELRVICGDVAAGEPTAVTHIELFFESLWGGETWIKGYSPFTRIVDHKAYQRAFGFRLENNSTDHE